MTSNTPITTTAQLIDSVKNIFNIYTTFDDRRLAIAHTILDNLELKSVEVSRYTFWDYDKAYTRNLVYTDNNFSVLLLCWGPGRESKIHNHPCDGCFSKF
jgi:cysteine dioxygenase